MDVEIIDEKYVIMAWWLDEPVVAETFQAGYDLAVALKTPSQSNRTGP
jgi:hypothetical protein